MRTFLCFPIPKSFHKKNKDNKARKNSAKVLDVSIWPGPDTFKSETQRDTRKLAIPSVTTLTARLNLVQTSTKTSPLMSPEQRQDVDKPRTSPSPTMSPELHKINNGESASVSASLASEEIPTPLSPTTLSQSSSESFPVTDSLGKTPAGESLEFKLNKEVVENLPAPVKSSYIESWVGDLVEFTPKKLKEHKRPREESPNPSPRKGKTSSAETAAVNEPSLELINLSKPKIHWIGAGLTTVPQFISYNNLKHLSLSQNSIVKIPRGVLPRNLQTLDLSYNQITNVEGLRGCALGKLRVLNLSNNRISSLGQALRECVAVRELYLGNNKVNFIEGLHKLRKLFVLDVSNNRLSSMDSISQLSSNTDSLEVLNLLHNPITFNLGEERVRRMVIDMIPKLAYFNKRNIKSVPAREFVFGRFSRTEPSSRSTFKKVTPATRAKIRRAQSLESHYRDLEASRNRRRTSSRTKSRARSTSAPRR